MIGIFKYLRNNKGQGMVELALVLISYLTFIFGLFVFSLWGAASFLASDASHEVARRYAVTLDEDKARSFGEAYLNKYGFIFIQPNSIQINLQSNNPSVEAEVIVKPRISTVFLFSVPEIKRTSLATMEHVFRSPGEYYQD